MIKCRGRNGPFFYHHHYAEVMGAEADAGALAFVEIFSNSPHTRNAPVTFTGPPREVARLLRKIAGEISAATRADSGAKV